MKRSFPGFFAALLLASTFGPAAAFAQDAPASPTVTGPDVTVYNLDSVGNYGGTNGAGGYHGYSVGTVSCNRGTTPLNWCDQAGGCAPGATSHDHPVIAQNMYRLKDGRFEQIGISWLKHGFVSTNSFSPGCTGSTGGTCVSPPFGGNQLGVGCTDPYGSGLNGSRPLGMRSEVDASTGAYPFPYTQVGTSAAFDQRVKVANVDLDPAQNTGALYWVEGQYVAPDDALAGNALNNASYRTVTVGASPNFTVSLGTSSSTVQAKSALYAWQVADPTVEISNVDMCTSPVERFEVARKVTEIVTGATWHYEYAVRNMNSEHAGGAFEVVFPAETDIRNGGARIVDHHSGEPYSTNPWELSVDTTVSQIRWESDPYTENANANALRWATMFSFWFDADAPPADAIHTVEPFEPLARADAGADAALCPGDSVQIGAPAIPGQTYLWAPGGETTAQITVSPASTMTYTVTATSGCGVAQDSVEVTIAPAGPVAPTLTSPADDAVVGLPIALAWDAVAGATSYGLEVANDAGFANPFVEEETGSTGYAIPGWLAPAQYFWRVTSYGNCPGATSATFDFTVDAVIFVDGYSSGDYSGGWTHVP